MKSLIKISLLLNSFSFSANAAAATVSCSWGAVDIHPIQKQYMKVNIQV